jgi:hypothetical protein
MGYKVDVGARRRREWSARHIAVECRAHELRPATSLPTNSCRERKARVAWVVKK